MITQQLKRKLQEQKSRIGLVGSKLEVGEFAGMEHNVEAFIKPEGWDITLKIREGFEPVQDKRQKAYARKKGIKDGLEVLLTDVLDHECGHWELPHGSGMGCPYDVYNHDLITEAVKNALPQDKQAHTSYVTNLFEDVIDNARCHDFRGDFGGQVLFWDHEGLSCKEKGLKGYTPAYEAFVKVNMHLWGDGADKALVKRHFTNEGRVDTAVASIVRDLSLKEKSPMAPLFNKKRWADMAGKMAKHLAPLLDVSPIERSSAYRSEEGQGSSGSGEQPQPSPGNGIEQKARSEDGKQDIVYGRYGAGQGPSPQFTKHDQLHALYSRLARDIPVKVDAVSREEELSIAPLNLRPFDAEHDDPSRVKLNRLYAVEGGRLTVGYERQPLVVKAREKLQRQSFPDFKLVMLDNSGSMKQTPEGTDNVGNKNLIPWGDKSKYHSAVLGFYGIENYIRKQGIAPFIRHGAALFSSTTRYKEADFNGVQAVYNHILSPDWGSTRIDAGALTKSLQGRESFMLSISDGDIENWDSEKDAFKKAVASHHYAHIQIGPKNDFCSDLASWGVPVYQVQRGEDLARLMVNTAQTAYRRFVKQ